MPSFRYDATTIHYEEFGAGFPILAFAGGGVLSTIAVWSQPASAINPAVAFADHFRVIVMDQRNTGGSRAPITAKDDWTTYTADHVALLDHLNIERCHLYGQCIGGSFILSFLKSHADRVASAVLAKPTGRIGPMMPRRMERFEEWVELLQDHPEATREVLDAVYRNLYAADFVHSVDRAFVRTCTTPCMVLAGNDEWHPFQIAEELSKLLPRCEFIPEWMTGSALEIARTRIKQFLIKHTPHA